MEKPKISIIMGIFNCEKTLNEAIESILNQTYTNWELIMCDDGSTDNTYSIAKRYETEFPGKFIVIKNDKNMGLNYTLNHCLKYANSEFIARMDGDDISLPTRFEKEINFLLANPEYSVVGTQVAYFDENGIFGKNNLNGAPLIKNMSKGTPFFHPTTILRKSAIDAVGGYSVSDRLLRAEDYELWVKLYAAGMIGYNLPEVLYHFRDDRNAVNRRKFKYRINEAYVACLAVKRLKLNVFNYIYALKPIITGLIPLKLYMILHKNNLKG